MASIADLPAKKWPYHDRSFAIAVARQASAGNDLAAKFQVTSGPTGFQSYEFREIRSLMHQATLISYDSWDNDFFRVRVSPRASKILLDRNKASDLERRQARDLLLAHWFEATGRHWEESVEE